MKNYRIDPPSEEQVDTPQPPPVGDPITGTGH